MPSDASLVAHDEDVDRTASMRRHLGACRTRIQQGQHESWIPNRRDLLTQTICDAGWRTAKPLSCENNRRPAEPDDNGPGRRLGTVTVPTHRATARLAASRRSDRRPRERRSTGHMAAAPPILRQTMNNTQNQLLLVLKAVAAALQLENATSKTPAAKPRSASARGAEEVADIGRMIYICSVYPEVRTCK